MDEIHFAPRNETLVEAIVGWYLRWVSERLCEMDFATIHSRVSPHIFGCSWFPFEFQNHTYDLEEHRDSSPLVDS